LCVCAYLVPQPLAGNHGNLIADALVGLEVEREFGVVALDDDLGGLLDRLRANATHLGGVGCVCSRGEMVPMIVELRWY